MTVLPNSLSIFIHFLVSRHDITHILLLLMWQLSLPPNWYFITANEDTIKLWVMKMNLGPSTSVSVMVQSKMINTTGIMGEYHWCNIYNTQRYIYKTYWAGPEMYFWQWGYNDLSARGQHKSSRLIMISNILATSSTRNTFMSRHESLSK